MAGTGIKLIYNEKRNSVDTIKKTDSIGRVKAVLQEHDIGIPDKWEIVMGMLLENCDYIKIEGYGGYAKFILCDDDQ